MKFFLRECFSGIFSEYIGSGDRYLIECEPGKVLRSVLEVICNWYYTHLAQNESQYSIESEGLKIESSCK